MGVHQTRRSSWRDLSPSAHGQLPSLGDMTKISADQIGLRDAAEVFGVSIDTLRRRIRDNQLDEALLVQGPFGATWVLPRNSLTEIAAREQWELLDVEVSREATEVPSAVPPVPSAVPPVPSAVPPVPSAVPPVPSAVPPVPSAVPPVPSAVPPVPSAVPPVPSAVPPVPTTGDHGQVIDLRRARLSEASALGTPDTTPASEGGAASGSLRTAPVTAEASPDQQDLVRQIQAAIASELHTALAENVEAELTRVRDAITSAEVRAVAAEARTDAIRTEQGRLQAQLKRAEADVEYWRSQHDRLDKELDRERTGRVAAERSKAVAETQASEAKSVSVELRLSLADAQDRERTLVRQEASVSAELDQAMVAMGWWSRRKLARLHARTAGRTQPPPAAD